MRAQFLLCRSRTFDDVYFLLPGELGERPSSTPGRVVLLLNQVYIISSLKQWLSQLKLDDIMSFPAIAAIPY